MNPKYLFCDEPNSGLDPETSTVIDKLIQNLTKEFNMTTIINTHDMNSVIEIGEFVLFISKGEVAWEGSNKEILETKNQKLNDFIFANKLYAQFKNEKENNAIPYCRFPANWLCRRMASSGVSTFGEL